MKNQNDTPYFMGLLHSYEDNSNIDWIYTSTSVNNRRRRE
jgi:hypothetical protein